MIGSTMTALHLVPAPAGDPVEASATAAPAAVPAALELVADPAPGVGTPARLRLVGERGMATAEYAVGLIAACAFAVVLYKVVTGAPIVKLLNALAAAALAVFAR